MIDAKELQHNPRTFIKDDKNTNIEHTNKDSQESIEPILLASPSSSTHRVTFDLSPKVKLISFNKNKLEDLQSKRKEKRQFKSEVRDKSIILCKSMLNIAKKRAKKYSIIIPSATNITLKYRNKEDMETDLRALGLKPKSYVENILIVHNFSYKETEESVFKFFSQFAKTEKVVLEKNSKGFCKGKGTVTFSTSFNPINEAKLYNLRLNGRLLTVERIKRQSVNTSRLFISHLNKKLKICDLRLILKAHNYVPKNIKVDLVEGRNRGYGFVDFTSPQEAQSFIEDYHLMKPKLGNESFVEFSQEKILKNKKK